MTLMEQRCGSCTHGISLPEGIVKAKQRHLLNNPAPGIPGIENQLALELP
jgi:hypothetical protein